MSPFEKFPVSRELMLEQESSGDDYIDGQLIAALQMYYETMPGNEKRPEFREKTLTHKIDIVCKDWAENEDTWKISAELKALQFVAGFTRLILQSPESDEPSEEQPIEKVEDKFIVLMPTKDTDPAYYHNMQDFMEGYLENFANRHEAEFTKVVPSPEGRGWTKYTKLTEVNGYTISRSDLMVEGATMQSHYWAQHNSRTLAVGDTGNVV